MKKMTAYERRKENSRIIAQLQFEPETPKYDGRYEHFKKAKDEYEYAKRKHEQFQKEMTKTWSKVPKSPEEKPTWTPLDQAKEEALWDE